MMPRNYVELYIDGKYVRPVDDAVVEVHEAATELVIGSVPKAGKVEVDTAVAAAKRAFPKWAALSSAQRRDWLIKIQKGLEARSEELAEVIAREVGSPIAFSRMAQVGLSIRDFAIAVEAIESIAFTEKIGNSQVVREPIGVVACITPWNYPLHQVAAKVAAALAAGCTVVVKPSEVAPLSAFILADIIASIGLPAGVFNLVSGYGPDVGEMLVSHPDVDMISLTGSTRAGRRVGEIAAQTVKKVSLELGGKSAAIVLDDADISAIAPGILRACYINSGQTCTAHTRLLVPKQRYGEAIDTIVKQAKGMRIGDPFDDATQLGPLASAAQRDRVREYISIGVAEGATLLTGGISPPTGLETGYFVQPTVFGDVTSDMTIAREEIFGPVLSILTYEGEEEAISIANDSIFGLSGAVWSRSVERAIGVANNIRTGQVVVNGGPFNPYAPFGGYKQSGNGRELGKFGIEEFLEYKNIQLPV